MRNQQDLTIIIPTHNRHHYLERVLAYYENSPFPILVADSSVEAFEKKLGPTVRYFHLPGLAMPQKLSVIFEKVTTPFLAMCADDDFIIPESLHHCVSFLSANPDYSVAGGNILCYRKSDAASGRVKFAVVFPEFLSYRIEHDDPWKRLDLFFKKYREIFYSVHRTENLRLAFHDIGDRITKLYLNEYLTVIIPTFRGNYALLPILYQVREELEAGGERNSPNINAIFHDDAYKIEYERLIDFSAQKISTLTGQALTAAEATLDGILKNFAKELEMQYSVSPKADPDKKIGKWVSILPFIGPWMIRRYREEKRIKKLKPYFASEKDEVHLRRIEEVIRKYPIR